MKEFLLSLFTFSFCIIISAQKVDYDNTSKLFMGVNLGGTTQQMLSTNLEQDGD